MGLRFLWLIFLLSISLPRPVSSEPSNDPQRLAIGMSNYIMAIIEKDYRAKRDTQRIVS
jgi:hypothetical protein